MDKHAYAGWPNCVRLANEQIELIATGDVGPRIIRFGFVGGFNEFWECEKQLGKVGGDEWRSYGGHRLWHAPEVQPRTYSPDNGPPQVKRLDDGGVRLIQTVEEATGIEKEIDIHLAPDAPRARITHRLRNQGPWGVELAPWAISVMAPGGTCIMPLPPRGPHAENLQPCNTLSMWAYTDLSDPRWTLGFKYVLLRQDPERNVFQKLGTWAPQGWIAHVHGGRLFVKQTAVQPGATYPDRGANIEAFTNKDMLEVETLGPMAKLEPGDAVEHVETWHLFQDVKTPASDADVDAEILPRLKEAGITQG